MMRKTCLLTLMQKLLEHLRVYFINIITVHILRTIIMLRLHIYYIYYCEYPLLTRRRHCSNCANTSRIKNVIHFSQTFYVTTYCTHQWYIAIVHKQCNSGCLIIDNEGDTIEAIGRPKEDNNR